MFPRVIYIVRLYGFKYFVGAVRDSEFMHVFSVIVLRGWRAWNLSNALLTHPSIYIW